MNIQKPVRSVALFLVISVTCVSAANNTYKNHHYRFFNGESSWTAAKEIAEEMGGYLACLEDKKELEFAHAQVPVGNTAWVGLTDAAEEGHWKWINGKSVSSSMKKRLEGGEQLEERDYGLLLLTGNLASRKEDGGLPEGWRGPKQVSGFVVEWDSEPNLEGKESLIDEWVSLHANNGLGVTYRFEEDGKVTLIFGITLNLSYQIEDNTLIIPMEDSNNTIKRQSFDLNGDTVVFMDEQLGKSPLYTRVVGPTPVIVTDPETGRNKKLLTIEGSPGDGLIGKWLGDYNNLNKQVIEITEDMRYNVLIPMRARVGKYSLRENTLIEAYPGSPDNELAWEIIDGILVLTSSLDKKNSLFEKKL